MGILKEFSKRKAQAVDINWTYRDDNHPDGDLVGNYGNKRVDIIRNESTNKWSALYDNQKIAEGLFSRDEAKKYLMDWLGTKKIATNVFAQMPKKRPYNDHFAPEPIWMLAKSKYPNKFINEIISQDKDFEKLNEMKSQLQGALLEGEKLHLFIWSPR